MINNYHKISLHFGTYSIIPKNQSDASIRFSSSLSVASINVKELFIIVVN